MARIFSIFHIRLKKISLHHQMNKLPLWALEIGPLQNFASFFSSSLQRAQKAIYITNFVILAILTSKGCPTLVCVFKPEGPPLGVLFNWVETIINIVYVGEDFVPTPASLLSFLGSQARKVLVLSIENGSPGFSPQVKGLPCSHFGLTPFVPHRQELRPTHGL